MFVLQKLLLSWWGSRGNWPYNSFAWKNMYIWIHSSALPRVSCIHLEGEKGPRPKFCSKTDTVHYVHDLSHPTLNPLTKNLCLFEQCHPSASPNSALSPNDWRGAGIMFVLWISGLIAMQAQPQKQSKNSQMYLLVHIYATWKSYSVEGRTHKLVSLSGLKICY